MVPPPPPGLRTIVPTIGVMAVPFAVTLKDPVGKVSSVPGSVNVAVSVASPVVGFTETVGSKTVGATFLTTTGTPADPDFGSGCPEVVPLSVTVIVAVYAALDGLLSAYVCEATTVPLGTDPSEAMGLPSPQSTLAMCASPASTSV